MNWIALVKALATMMALLAIGCFIACVIFLAKVVLFPLLLTVLAVGILYMFFDNKL